MKFKSRSHYRCDQCGTHGHSDDPQLPKDWMERRCFASLGFPCEPIVEHYCVTCKTRRSQIHSA